MVVKIVINNEFHTVRGYQLLEQNRNKLTSAMEDYLEMIYRNSIVDGYIRINQLADLLHVRAASASRMVQKLGGMGLLIYKKYGIIVLSESGKEIGAYLLSRHHTIESFLQIISCEDDILEQTELMEHDFSPRTVNNLNILISFFNINKDISDSFNEFKENYSSTIH